MENVTCHLQFHGQSSEGSILLSQLLESNNTKNDFLGTLNISASTPLEHISHNPYCLP